MEIKQVKCASCGAILSVRNSQNEDEKVIACPQCKAQLKVKFHHVSPQEPLDAHTYVAPKREASGDTQLGGASNEGATQLAGAVHRDKIAMLVANGIEYRLSMGQNIVGRKAATSTATVQIATEDRFMSRQHAIINVVRLNSGSVKAILSNYQNKNTTTVNGESLATGDEIILTSGCAIQMGNTRIAYKEK